jgi:hypothetical protein
MKIFMLLAALVGPAVIVFRALAVIGAIALGAILDPTGAFNALICRLIDFIALYWPSTPPSLKLANLLFPTGANQSLGHYFLVELFSTAFIMLSIVALVKLYKLIPFKMT